MRVSHDRVHFAKLSLLNAVGAISDEHFGNCVGAAVSGEAPPGIDFPESILFGSELASGYAEASGVPVFDMIGSDGGSYDFLLEIALASEASSPLGTHRLDGIGYGNIFDPWLNGAYLAHTIPTEHGSASGASCSSARLPPRRRGGSSSGWSRRTPWG